MDEKDYACIAVTGKRLKFHIGNKRVNGTRGINATKSIYSPRTFSRRKRAKAMVKEYGDLCIPDQYLKWEMRTRANRRPKHILKTVRDLFG